VNGLQLPSWMVPAAGVAAAVWAIAMWWMVATLPSTGASDADLQLIVARAEIDSLEVDVDELSQQVSALHQERADLSLRLDALEGAPSTLAAQTTQPITPVAGAPDAAATDDADDDADKPDPTPSASPSASPSATATPAPKPTVVATATPPPAVQYFTDGRDRYNCRDFKSWEEAQAAYEANLPGDPNKIDIDRNGIACEALRK